MILFAASFRKTRPPKGYHEIYASIEGRRKTMQHLSITDITARVYGYPYSREYKLRSWRRTHGIPA